MNDSQNSKNRGIWWLSILSAITVLVGCQSPGNTKMESEAASVDDPKGIMRLRPGDLVSVVFSGVANAPDRVDSRIPENGSFSLPYIGIVKAEGKTVGELQQEIHDRYVTNNYYTFLTVTVNSENRYYSVDGEVRQPARQIYAGETTVLSAIASVGGFTDFANKKKVQLIRANGKVFFENCKRAKDKPSLDLPVYPGDKIIVPRRLY